MQREFPCKEVEVFRSSRTPKYRNAAKRRDMLALIKDASREKDLGKGRQAHVEVVASGMETDVYVSAGLVNMYTKCGSLKDAQAVFNQMTQPDVVLWTSLMLGYVENKEFDFALELFVRMLDSGVLPDRAAFVTALKACSGLATRETGHQINGRTVKSTSLERAMAIHSEALKNSNLDGHVGSSLISLYSKCGSMVDATRAFSELPRHNVVSCTALMLGYVANGEAETSLELFVYMRNSLEAEPDEFTYAAAIQACSKLAEDEGGEEAGVKYLSLERGMVLHSEVDARKFGSDAYVASSLMDMYTKCGSMSDARQVFERTAKLERNVVAWTGLVLGYADNGESEAALCMFEQFYFRHGGDALAFVAALKACSTLSLEEQGEVYNGKVVVKVKTLERAMALHSEAAQAGYKTDVRVATSLIKLYGQCGSVVDARAVFDNMRERNEYSRTAMAAVYVENGEGDAAVELLRLMDTAPSSRTLATVLKAGSILDEAQTRMALLERAMAVHARAGENVDVHLANELIKCYVKSGSFSDAYRVLEQARTSQRVKLKDKVTLKNSFIWSCLETGEYDLALGLVSELDYPPDTRTLTGLLKACAGNVSLNRGRVIHSEICRRGLEESPITRSALVDFYGKCGDVVKAQLVFESTSVSDVVTWTSLLAGYSSRGDAELLFAEFEKMVEQGVRPGGVSFLVLLSCCSRAGLVQRGIGYFERMQDKYEIVPGAEHYHCMLDLLGRANLAEEAVALARGRIPFEAGSLAWTSLVGNM